MTAIAPGAGAEREARTAGGEPAATALAIVLALLALGLAMVYSTTAIPGDRIGDPTYYFRRQLLWTALALGALVLAWQTDYRTLLRWRGPILAVALVLLAAVLVKNAATHEVKGARRWFEFGAMKAQPSELAKVALVLFLAGHCADPRALSTLRRAAPAFGAVAATLALILPEPDSGTTAFLGVVSGVLLLVAGVRLSHALLVGVPVVGVGAIYALARLDHVRARIAVFLDPAADPLGKGYQIQQSLIALGSGGAIGAGLGESRQKLFFLPDDHTDFILAIVGEELGLLGTLAVLALFAGLIVAGMRIAARAPDRPGFLLAVGITTTIGLQAAINMAVVTASMPTKGIPLPFVSYGGSSLVVGMFQIGVLLSVARAGRAAQARARGT